ncbi:tRNA uridine-5-carboxymethylaminomethyl(34) synthesis GTPase MnmE [Desulfogranum mediterraneum]|uniref:tRNA uridine-5-carboxymethylaminomethyl(34) synthesis GTPase MnmE n=1 Tax=Desulfogranum mediterraneum TaxID=160661 RepID=UPI000426FADD|nr:tRNA uridine-5-carboxymethylaminomethyl(34) synthesis GTPase MnmE [Desulfogranum mediterraneum]
MAALQKTDTIAAIATPPGTGGIGIIRISGDGSLAILKRLFRPHHPQAAFESHKLSYGTLCNQEGEVVDEILAVYMKGPATYTREDVVEFHCHGSPLLLRRVLQLVFASGARPADPGEFTKRAFLAGRLDLTQAEAVIELLQAETDRGISLAVHQLQGQLSQELEAVRRELIAILAVLEVAIDFPDDEVELLDVNQISTQLAQNILAPLEALIRLASGGKIIREGISVVIAGRPNVGKSSLLNTLLQEDRALVTPVAGTTRDTIEELISIRGIPVHLVDTAGIRAHSDLVEELGMERARRKMKAADLVLFLVDGSVELTDRDEELYAFIAEREHLVVINKEDRADPEQLAQIRQHFGPRQVLAISAQENRGVDELKEAVYQAVCGEQGVQEVGRCAPNLRHLVALEKTAVACRGLEAALDSGASCDLLAVEAQAALDYLGDIIGLTTPDDVLEAIFAEFCIGK